LDTLRDIQDMAERHATLGLARANAAMTAAADPSEYIDPDWVDEFIDLGVTRWGEARALIHGVLGELPTPLFQSTIAGAIADAARTYDELLTAVIGKGIRSDRTPIYGEFRKGAVVQYGDVRPILVNLGGGSTDSTVPLMGGVATGNTMKQWLSNNGIETNRKIWLYGYEDEPRRTFNGHLQMDGLVFKRWDDEGLQIAPQDAWLRRSHYQPGDHRGCACVVAPYIPNFGEPYQLDLPSV
jgi:hypothetical protein